MESKLAVRIERARELLKTVRHAALATVNTDGTPHNSPVFAGFGAGTTMYWASAPETQHSQNIIRTGQVFIVLFDSMDKGDGLYLRCSSGLVADDAIEQGLAVFNTSLTRLGRTPIAREHIADKAPQRLYYAQPEQVWVNMPQKDTAGRVLYDARCEIVLADLL